MGESPDRIHLVGAPGLDAIRQFRKSQTTRAARRRLAELLGPVADQPYAVVVQHAFGRATAVEAKVMRAVIDAVQRSGLAGVAIWPNSDPGHDGIIRELRYLAGRPGWRVFRSLVREDYLRAVQRAAVLVGNSSSGIIESASLGVCAVNIGSRQEGRLRCGKNVIDAGESPAAITQAIKAALGGPRPDPDRSVYGDGRAGERIAGILKRVSVGANTCRKALSY
jgi:GDP/UDP-N,N'-diacetylbacillosamine 2-epimerase (hydrolysing)